MTIEPLKFSQIIEIKKYNKLYLLGIIKMALNMLIITQIVRVSCTILIIR